MFKEVKLSEITIAELYFLLYIKSNNETHLCVILIDLMDILIAGIL